MRTARRHGKLNGSRSRSTTLPADLDLSALDPLVLAAVEGAADKQATDITVLRVGEVLAICEWFVIASGSNPRQVRTIADEVERRVKEAGGIKALRVEGLDDLRWVLLDYGDIVVHVFLDEVRRHYDLERLWSDVPRLNWNDQPVVQVAAD